MFQRVFFENTNDRTEKFQDLSLGETLTFLPVIVLIILMGIYPQPFINKIEPAAQQQIAKVYSSTQTHIADSSVRTPEHQNHKN